MGLKYRKDALTAASEMIRDTPNEAVSEHSEITFYTDIRSNDVNIRNQVQTDASKQFYDIGAKYGIDVEISDPTEQSQPQQLDKTLGNALADSANDLNIDFMYLPSGAGHDAMKASQAGIPTAMLFVPSKDGLSHNPNEFTDNKYIARATEVMANTLINLQR